MKTGVHDAAVDVGISPLPALPPPPAVLLPEVQLMVADWSVALSLPLLPYSSLIAPPVLLLINQRDPMLLSVAVDTSKSESNTLSANGFTVGGPDENPQPDAALPYGHASRVRTPHPILADAAAAEGNVAALALCAAESTNPTPACSSTAHCSARPRGNAVEPGVAVPPASPRLLELSRTQNW